MKWYQNKLIKKLFLTTTDWNAAFKFKDEKSYKLVQNPEGYWLADTLIFNDNDNYYLFVEAYDKKKSIGKISVLSYDFESKKFENFKIIIENDYHMSYPYVFKYKNSYYMIPESSENNCIEIYIAKEFPYVWEKVKELVHGSYVDTSLFQLEGEKYKFYTYDIKNKKVISGILDMDSLDMHFESEKNDVSNSFRPGGKIFEQNGKILMPFQNNLNFYGQSLNVVNCENKKIEFEIKPEEIPVVSYSKYRRLHTYSVDGNMEAIDLSNFRFNLLKPIIKLVKK